MVKFHNFTEHIHTIVQECWLYTSDWIVFISYCISSLYFILVLYRWLCFVMFHFIIHTLSGKIIGIHMYTLTEPHVNVFQLKMERGVGLCFLFHFGINIHAMKRVKYAPIACTGFLWLLWIFKWKQKIRSGDNQSSLGEGSDLIKYAAVPFPELQMELLLSSHPQEFVILSQTCQVWTLCAWYWVWSKL